MDNSGRWFIGSVTLVAVIFILSITLYSYSRNLLIKAEPTCAGKVLLQSWNSDSAQIMALQACADVDNGYEN